jgi:hypothetical protein
MQWTKLHVFSSWTNKFQVACLRARKGAVTPSGHLRIATRSGVARIDLVAPILAFKRQQKNFGTHQRVLLTICFNTLKLNFLMDTGNKSRHDSCAGINTRVVLDLNETERENATANSSAIRSDPRQHESKLN